MLLLLAAAALADPVDLPAGFDVADTVLHPFRGGDRVRVRVSWAGLPVDGADRVVVGHRLSGPELVAPTGVFAVSADDAVAVARQVVGGRGDLWRPRAAAVVAGFAGRRAWRIDLATVTPLRAWRVWVDGETGRPLGALPRSWSADGAVYPGSPLDSDVEDVVLEGLLVDDALSGEHADVWSCDVADIDETLFGTSLCEVSSRHAAPDDVGDFRFTPDPASFEDPFAEVQLYYHLDRVARFAEDTWGFRRAAPTRGYVNFEMANAFYGDFDGDGVPDMAFGQTEGGVDFAYDPDVVYHEFGHGVVDGTASLGFLDASDLGLVWDGAALNEGTADVVTLLLTADPDVGEYAGSGFDRPAIRELAAPRRCPDDLVGEAHADGRIWGHLFWTLAEDPSVGREAAAELLYGAMATWTLRTTWEEAGQSLLDAADDLVDAGAWSDDARDAVVLAVDAANLIGCERIVPLDDGATRTALLVFTGLPGALEILPGEVQYALTLPEDGARARIVVDAFSGDPEIVGYRVHARYDHPVGHTVTDLSLFGVRTAVPMDFDVAVDGSGAGVALRVSETGDLPYVPGATLYVSLASRPAAADVGLDLTFVRADLRAEVDEAARGGCACDGGGGLPLAPWLPALVALWRRRRGGGSGLDAG